ncbi:hypothetical protein C5167_050423 [Papaver somniferum]|uniref:Uncharacterized protein n=1 Tax=Papaver somniferum TaxID=3469 RepID=A0A4Y7KS25_PAPSO|nr:hypothetical protein C5167_050423 [Papaver somniferum]
MGRGKSRYPEPSGPKSNLSSSLSTHKILNEELFSRKSIGLTHNTFVYEVGVKERVWVADCCKQY